MREERGFLSLPCDDFEAYSILVIEIGVDLVLVFSIAFSVLLRPGFLHLLGCLFLFCFFLSPPFQQGGPMWRPFLHLYRYIYLEELLFLFLHLLLLLLCLLLLFLLLY